VGSGFEPLAPHQLRPRSRADAHFPLTANLTSEQQREQQQGGTASGATARPPPGSALGRPPGTGAPSPLDAIDLMTHHPRAVGPQALSSSAPIVWRLRGRGEDPGIGQLTPSLVAFTEAT
jgi:hypothetical protein